MTTRERFNHVATLVARVKELAKMSADSNIVQAANEAANAALRELIREDFSVLRAVEVCEIAGWVYSLGSIAPFRFLMRCQGIVEEVAKKEKPYSELRTLIQEIVGDNYLYLSEAVSVPVDFHPCVSIWAVSVSPSEKIYVMDSSQEWHELDESETTIVNMLYTAVCKWKVKYSK